MRVKKYPTTEHAFQAAKTLDEKEREKIRVAKTPGQAKRLGQKVTLRKDWESIKIKIMLNLNRQKFDRADLGDRLVDTGQAELIEGNTWGDTFWGVCKGVGKNHLGKILMEVREELVEYRPMLDQW